MLDHKNQAPRGVNVMIRIFTLIVISALISGCQEETVVQEETNTDDCVGSSLTPINIKFAKNEEADETQKNGVTGIEVNPAKAKTHLGYKLQFHLIGNSETIVTISGKESKSYPDSDWIKGVGKGGDFIHVCVPDLDIPEGPEGKTYGYDIAVEGIGTLDPMVVVRR